LLRTGITSLQRRWQDGEHIHRARLLRQRNLGCNDFETITSRDREIARRRREEWIRRRRGSVALDIRATLDKLGGATLDML
jgi:hypothetical protein